MNLFKKQNSYQKIKNQNYLKYKVAPYLVLICGLLLTIFYWYAFCIKSISLGGSARYAIPLLGLSTTFFVFGMLLIYSRSYDWALKMTDAITEHLKRNTKDLTDKVKIIEIKNRDIARDNVKMEALLQNIGEGMIAFDKKGHIEIMNEAAKIMLGCESNDSIGKECFREISIQNEEEKDILKEKHPITLALSTGNKISSSLLHQFYFTRRDKTKFPVALVATPVILNKKIDGAIMVFRDITREWDIDKSKTEFVSLASHQLRTPLSTIGWYAEMLLSGDAGKLNPEQEDYMKEIYNGNRRMVELVNSLLNVSRIELGTLAIESEMTNFIEVCESVIKEVAPSLDVKKIELTKKYDSKLSLIKADPKLVRIIFQNLLTNAVKYTPEKGKISVEITQKEQDILIKVSDTGYGIPEHQKNKIFSKLFRADNAREKEAEGTGLGLYIIKMVIDSAKGKIWFDSKEKEGTTFYVTIPLSGMQRKDGTKNLIEEPAFNENSMKAV